MVYLYNSKSVFVKNILLSCCGMRALLVPDRVTWPQINGLLVIGLSPKVIYINFSAKSNSLAANTV